MCIYGKERTKHWEKKKKKHNEHLEGLINKVGSMPSNTVSRKPNEESYQYNRGRKHSQLFPTWLKKVKSWSLYLTMWGLMLKPRTQCWPLKEQFWWSGDRKFDGSKSFSVSVSEPSSPNYSCFCLASYSSAGLPCCSLISVFIQSLGFVLGSISMVTILTPLNNDYVSLPHCLCAQSLSSVQLFVTPWTVACQTPVHGIF